MPLVSVVIPAYNAEKFVLQAVRSVLQQCYQPLEIWLVDDGSTDQTAEIVRQHAPTVKIVRQENAGVAAARNTGVQLARGELICFLDADDGWLPGKLAAQVAYMQAHPEVGLLYHDWLVWRPDATGAYPPLPATPPECTDTIDNDRSGWIYHRLLLDSLVHTSTAMIRSQVMADVGLFDPHLKLGEDYDYWLRVSRQWQMHKLKAVYSFYRAVPGSLSNVPSPQNTEYLLVQNAVKQWGLASPNGVSLAPAQLNDRLAGIAFGFGYSHFYRGNPAVAKQAFLHCLQHKPLHWRALCYAAASQVRCITGL
jgi:glycosyltransferase involved in cell wall biosynthesis